MAQVDLGDSHGAQEPILVRYAAEGTSYPGEHTCFACNKVGHLAKYRKTPGPPCRKGARADNRLTLIEVRSNGEGITPCYYEVKEGHYARTGLLI